MLLKFKCLFAFSLIAGVCLAQPTEASQLIGEWQFIELRDHKGRARKVIPLKRWGKTVKEIVNRDSYHFRADSTFTATNSFLTSHGIWWYKATTDEIYLQSSIDSASFAFDELKAKGYVTKKDDGHYYTGPIAREILEFSPDEMIIADRDYYVLQYKKIISREPE